MVEIYLSLPEDQIHFLSIPLRDIKRLAFRPFKWLRFVVFCTCGAKGQLSAAPNGPPVDYDAGITSLTDDDKYYYTAGGRFIFVDPYCLDEKMTSDAHTARRTNFRTDIVARDGPFCVVTGEYENSCEAAHFIPLSKGDEYAQKVVNDRSPLYGLSPSTFTINDIANGVLVSKSVHALLSEGDVAFLKTPGFGLEAADIPRYDRGSTGTDRIILHRLEAPPHYDAAEFANFTNLMSRNTNPHVYFAAGANVSAGANVDALIGGTETLPSPSSVILDYMYGVAAYTLWGMSGMDGMIEVYFKSHYKPVLERRPNPPCDDDNDDGDGYPDDPEDADYEPSATQTRYASTPREGRLVKGMDKLNTFLMYLNGVSPQEVFNLSKKRLEEEERIAQEASRLKVMEWMTAGSS